MNEANVEPTIEELAAIFNYELKRRPLDTLEATELCRYKSIETLANKRSHGGGPRYFKQDKHVLYSEVDVLRWLYKGMASNTSQYLTPQQALIAQRTANASAGTGARQIAAVQK